MSGHALTYFDLAVTVFALLSPVAVAVLIAQVVTVVLCLIPKD